VIVGAEIDLRDKIGVVNMRGLNLGREVPVWKND
jgi:hypothetical protein